MNLRKVEERDTITCVPLLFCICFPKRIAQRVGWLINLLVSLISTHFADSVLQHSVLLEEVVHRFLTLCVVVHRSLEEEGEETLDATAAGTGGQVAEQAEVEQQRCGKDGVAAEEVDLNLHGIVHPAEDVDVVPSLLVVVARRIVVDAHLVVVLGVFVVAVSVEVGLYVGLQYCLKCRELRNLLSVEVCGLIKYKTIAVAKNVG